MFVIFPDLNRAVLTAALRAINCETVRRSFSLITYNISVLYSYLHSLHLHPYFYLLFKPKDMARINEKRKEFSQNSNQSNQRYHAEEVEERFAKYKPGIMRSAIL